MSPPPQNPFPLLNRLDPGAVKESIILLWQRLAQLGGGTVGPAGPAGPPGAPGAPGSAASVLATVLAGNVAGAFTVPGIAVGNVLVLVVYFPGAGFAVTDVSDLTSEFTITAPNTIDNTAGTDTTGGKLIILWSVP